MKQKTLPKIRTGSSGSVLASLFRTIRWDIGLDTKRFDVLLEQYIIKTRLPSDSRNKSVTRSTLKKELTKDKMSWNIFIKGLVFLNVKKFDLSLTLHHANKTKTIHTTTVVLAPNETIDAEQELEEDG